MEKLRMIDEKICEMRILLQGLIDEKSNLIDPQIVAASQELDEILNEYNKLLTITDKQNKK